MLRYLYKKCCEINDFIRKIQKAIEIYNNITGIDQGRQLVSRFIQMGVPKEHLVWFTTMVVKDKIPLPSAFDAYKNGKNKQFPIIMTI